MQDPQSLHKYLYVHGDPIQGVDPTGQFSLSGLGVRIAAGGRMVAQQLPTLSRIAIGAVNGGRSLLTYIGKNAVSWFANAFFPTGIGAIITANSSLASWFGATVTTFVGRMVFTAGMNYLINDAIRDNVNPALSELRSLAHDTSAALAGIDFSAIPGVPAVPGQGAEAEILSRVDSLQAAVDGHLFNAQYVQPVSWLNNGQPSGQFGLVGTLGVAANGFNAYFGGLAGANTVLNQVIRAVYDKLPAQGKQIVVSHFGFPNGINSLYVEPDPANVFWQGVWRTLNPEQEIRRVRIALQSLAGGNVTGAANDLVSAIRGLSKYGSVMMNDTRIL